MERILKRGIEYHNSCQQFIESGIEKIFKYFGLNESGHIRRIIENVKK